MSVKETPGEFRRTRPVGLRRRDPLRPHRAVTGIDARIRWYERVRALFVLIVVVLVLGAGLAVLIGLVFLLGSVFLEILAG